MELKEGILTVCQPMKAQEYETAKIDSTEVGGLAEEKRADAHGFMDGLSVHYYAGVEKGLHKGSATEFGEEAWFNTCPGLTELKKCSCATALS